MKNPLNALFILVMLWALIATITLSRPREDKTPKQETIDLLLQNIQYREDWLETSTQNLNDYCNSIWIDCKHRISSWANEKLEVQDVLSGVSMQDKTLMAKICDLWQIHDKQTLLCNDWKLFDKLKSISLHRWVDFWLMVWISYSESHIWINFRNAKWELDDDCSKSNNWWGIKAAKMDDGSVDRPQLPSYTVNEEWCRLYNFASVEQYRGHLANTIKMWYYDAQCTTPECISKYYVGKRWEVKEYRAKRVRLFMDDNSLLAYKE